MKKMYRLVVATLLMCVFGVGVAHAKSAYWTAELGAFSSEESEFDLGYSLEGAYGVPMTSLITSMKGKGAFWDKVWLEAGTGYTYAEFEETTVIPGIPGLIPDQVIKVEGDVSVIPATLTGLVRHPVNNKFELYGGAGLGFYFVMLDSGASDDDSIETGIHMEGGVALSFTEKLAGTAELKWSKIGEDAAGGINANLGVRYSF